MATPAEVPNILADAARLIRRGELVVFGSGALAYWLPDAPSSKDVDVWVVPPERGDPVVAVMGERSWYHQKHLVFVEVWGPETFCAPSDWRARAQHVTMPDSPDVVLTVPHPHDVLLAKLERLDPNDLDHVHRILAWAPLTAVQLQALANATPYRTGVVTDPLRTRAFEAHLARVAALAITGP